MMIRVVFCSGATGLAKAIDLEPLIKEAKVLAFCRSEGWVRIAHDPIRKKQRPFTGSGRRWSDLVASETG